MVCSGCFVVFISFLSFRALHLVLPSILPTPNTISNGPRRKQWLFFNISISFIHSFISAGFSLVCFISKPAMLSDLIGTWTWFSYYCVSFSAGYFWHDLLDMAWNDFNKSLSLLIHHAVVCTAFSLAILSQQYLGFAVYALLMEISSVFLHTRRLMLFHRVKKTSTKYIVNGVILLGTFLIFRFFTTAWVSYFMLKHWRKLPLLHVVSSTFAMVCITALNMNLLMSLWILDVRQRKQENAC